MVKINEGRTTTYSAFVAEETCQATLSHKEMNRQNFGWVEGGGTTPRKCDAS